MKESDAQTLGIIGSNKNPIKVALREYQGVRTIDIRKFYFDKSTKELKPTTKGIAVTLGNYQELINLLIINENEITQWLQDSLENKDAASIHLHHKNSVGAKEIARTAIVPYTVERSKQKTQAFFNSESYGGKDALILNQSHQIIAALKQLNNTENGAEELLINLLASFHRAKSLFSGTNEKMLPDEIFDTLEFNWGLFLNKLLSKKDTK